MILFRTCRLYLKHQNAAYSTLPKQAAGKFTSNKLISPHESDHVQRTLVYIGNLPTTSLLFARSLYLQQISFQVPFQKQ